VRSGASGGPAAGPLAAVQVVLLDLAAEDGWRVYERYCASQGRKARAAEPNCAIRAPAASAPARPRCYKIQ